ncbi:MAG TPA: hypothetical protein VJZ93_00705 [Candidatus Nanoarchaeia archaeon]|nr:hypothetical protein [Candidatus Nanoarchaeia archaeon]
MKIDFTWRIWLLIVILLLSLLSIFGSPTKIFQEGVLVTSVESNSTASNEGLQKGQIIEFVDGKKVTSLEDYLLIMNQKFPSENNLKTVINTKDSEIIFFTNDFPEITVSEIPKTNLVTGLDISGGSRALVKPQDVSLSSEETNDLVDLIRNRFNVYGIEDVSVSKVSDLSGDEYVRVEIAGTTPEDLRALISEQGKFEAKIGEEVVFVGGEKDITSVARSGEQAVIESCQKSTEFYFCNFRFTIFLSEDAAKRHADITSKLGTNSSADGNYLSKKLDLFIDGKLVDSLFINEGLKGQVTTQISITGSGFGETEDDAYEDAFNSMNRLQTILITGSLPYKLEIVKLDTISSSFGDEFSKSILIAGIVSLFAVSIFVFLRYRNFKSSLALIFTSISEVIIILGIASLIRWNLDLPSIAGILATIGTGIDQQIIILDESREKSSSINFRLKRALVIIVAAYFTGLVAMIPLYWAAAGFFKGFALTTIIGITAGVLITRPAFSDIVKKIQKD